MNPYKSHQIETSVWRVSLMALGLAILFLYLKNVSYHVKISKTVRKKPFVAKVSVVLVSKTHRRDKCLTKRWLCALFCVSVTRNRSAHNLPGILSLHFLFMKYKGIQVKFHSIFPIYEAFLWLYSINEKEKKGIVIFVYVIAPKQIILTYIRTHSGLDWIIHEVLRLTFWCDFIENLRIRHRSTKKSC